MLKDTFMTAFNHIANEIERHKAMLDEWNAQAPWYRHSTAGMKKKALCEYAIEVLTGIQDNCDEGKS